MNMIIKGAKSASFHPVSSPDYLPVEKLRELQLERLKKVVKRAYDNVKLTHDRMEEANVTPDSIKTLDDIRLLPFTIKYDLRDTYPKGLFACPDEDIVRLHASSGTTGKPIVVAYTRNDLKVWTETMARSLAAVGIGKHDIVQNSYGYGLFTGGLGAHYGAEELGAMVVPASGGNTSRQIMLIQDFGVTAITCTPSYFLHLLEEAQKMGINMRNLPIRRGVFGAEPWTEEMRKYIEEASGIKAFDIYGLSEITGPGVGCECECQCGLHIFEDYYYPEIIDPDTLEVLPDGKEGELVFTTLAKEAIPMIRYRTRDITSLVTEKCACGRTIRRISKISRRSDDMFIIRGVNVFPSQIEAAILNEEKTLPNYQIILTRSHGLDDVKVQIELTPEMYSVSSDVMAALKERFSRAIARVLNIRVAVTLLPPNSLPRSEGKAKRVVDNRNL